MKAIPREVGKKRSISWSREIRQMQRDLSLTKEQQELLVGSILGDGCLIANANGKNFRLQMAQCNKQKGYLDWKFSKFASWCISAPVAHIQTNSWQFRTISHPEFTTYRNIFYQKRKKVVPHDIREMITPQSLAVWFMDDGALGPRGDGLILNTQNFSEEDNMRLKNALEVKYNFSVAIHRDKKYFRLFVHKRTVPSFVSLIQPFLLSEMRYKTLLP